ncbi:MAG: hypothetical protein WBY94_12885, partial [Polyangiaceae bacterium]
MTDTGANAIGWIQWFRLKKGRQTWRHSADHQDSRKGRGLLRGSMQPRPRTRALGAWLPLFGVLGIGAVAG